MESFNFGAFDTQLPGRIAAIPQEAEKQRTANMLQAMQVQSAMNQNELAQSQIRTARRAEEGQTLLGKAYGGLDFSGAGTGGVPGQSPFASMKAQIIKSLTASGRADLIPGQLEKLTEMEHKENVNKEIEGKIKDQAVKAIDAAYKPFAKNAFSVRNDDNDASITSHHTAMQAHPIIGPIMRTFKTPEQALADDIADIKKPGGLEKWQALNANLDPKELANLVLKVTKRTQNVGTEDLTFSENQLGQQIGPVVRTPIGVSPNTTASIDAARKNHLETLAQAGWSFDTDRGIAVNARQGISRPISALIPPSLGGASTAPTVGGAGLSSVATGGGVPGQRQAPAGQPAAGVLGPKPTRISPNELRDEVNALTKDFRVVQDAHTKIKNVANTGAGDMSLLYSFIKLLDPGSVVRESEFAAAAQSGSYGERIQGAVNRALTGQRLPDALRQDFIREADNLYRSQKSGTDRVIKHYTGIAERAGLDPQDVIFPYAAPEVAIPEQAPAGAVRIKRK